MPVAFFILKRKVIVKDMEEVEKKETTPEHKTTRKRKGGTQVKQKATNDTKRKANVKDFVSSVDSNIYAIAHLPEEFIATLFAWVSRSPKSFREHLEEAINDFSLVAPSSDNFNELDEKAKAFHSKWTVGYGHSSVGEHAVVHMALEQVSRLASAELELASQFLSITEYSQRYQKPVRGGWYNPYDSSQEQYKEFEEYMNQMFIYFEQLNEILYDEAKEHYLKLGEGYELARKNTDESNKKINRDLRALEKKAFEDARYLLPLSIHTQLGVTANARAWRDVISTLGNSSHKEMKDCAVALNREASKIVPVLLRHSEPSQFERNVKIRKADLYKDFHVKTQKEGASAYVTQTLSEEVMLRQLVTLMTMEETNVSYEEAAAFALNQTSEQLRTATKIIIHEMKEYDNPIQAFKSLRVNAVAYVSEANWHQLLRHNRGADFTYGKPSSEFGYVTPPSVKVSKRATALFNEALQYATDKQELFDDEVGAEYVVLNAHIRPVHISADMYEMYHLVNLRTSEEAQWEIRDTFIDIYNSLAKTHPYIVSMMPRRNPEVINKAFGYLKGGEE